MRRISGVLFDVGGVLVGLDGVPSLAKLLQIEPLHDEIHRRWIECPSVIRHETGHIAADQFAIEVVRDPQPIGAPAFGRARKRQVLLTLTS